MKVEQRANWARITGRKWHWIKDGVNLESVGHRIMPECSRVPGMGNARAWLQGKGTRLSVEVPQNRRKVRWGRGLGHLCQHCVIAAASNGYRFD